MNEETNTQSNNSEKKQSIFKRPIVQSIVGIVVVGALLGGFIYWVHVRNTVSVENSFVQAPTIDLSSDTPGTLNAIYVKPGDSVPAGTQVALVGTDVVTTKLAGTIITADNIVGQYFAPGQTVVSMISTADVRVVGQVGENKGLKDIAVGDGATFTVDAFGNKTYEGVVDSIAPTADTTGVAFSISDARPTEKFDIKVKFDTAAYPELKNGMSAKITVHTR